MEKQQEQLLLGALLHGVGKFVIRSRKSGEGKDHCELGEEWLQQYENQLPPGLPAFARLHHARYFNEIRQTNLTLLVYHADNLSAAGDRIDKEGVFDHRGTPLASIFSRLTLSNTARKQYFLPLKPIGKELLFPQPLEQIAMGDEAYDAILQLFTRDFEQWLSMGRPIGALPVLLEKYWSTIPSETKWVWSDEKTFPDISLYDHTKTTAAFALALYLYFREAAGGTLPNDIIIDLAQTQLDSGKPYFRIVGGDFSGVQRFIYTLSSRGALKGLRGRSFFLELLTEHVVDELLLGLGLSRTNLIFAGGGHFYLLCQNTPQAEGVISTVREVVNCWLRKEFGLRLSLTLTSVATAARDLTTRTVSQVWQKVGEELGKEKGLRFRSELTELMVPQEPLLEGCAVCHRDDLAAEELGPLRHDDPNSPRACQFCCQLYEFGDDLTREKNYLVAEKRPAGQPSREALQLPTQEGSFLVYRLLSSLRDNTALERGFVLNSWDLEDYVHPTLAPLFHGGYVARVEDLPAEAQRKERDENPDARFGSTASLAGLARASTGIDRIAALRMDVDHMGKLLSRGFPSPSFSRLASFSRQLSLFFKYHLRSICEGKIATPLNVSGKLSRKRGRHLGVVYSGGDDLFVIGAWDDVLEFAIDVQRVFQRFTGNPEITVSAGVVIQDPHFPLYHIADEAGAAEDHAKNQGRNRLTLALFSEKQEPSQEQQIYTWQEVETEVLPLLRNFLALGEYMTDARRMTLKLPKALIYRLFGLIEEWKNDGRLYLPRMAYTLRRLQEAVGRNNAQIEWGGIQRALMTPENMAQYQKSQDATVTVPLACTVVSGKVRNALALLTRHHRNYPDRGFDPCRDELDRLLRSVEGAESLASLRGFEGTAARTYFAGFALACRTELQFEGRRRRPPTDPVNALLSFGYTLVGAELTSLLDAMGYDPYIGFYHQLDYGRPSLALDVLEEFRVPAVDRLVLNLTNLRTLQASDFVTDEESGGLRLERKALGKFFRAYEAHLNKEFTDKLTGTTTSLRKAFRQQAERLAAHVTKGEQYVPFLAEW